MGLTTKKKDSRQTGATAAVAKALQEVGPMTLQEVMQHTGYDKSVCSHALRSLNKSLPTIPKRAYIKLWAYDHEGQRRYPRAVYAWGARTDAKKPERDVRETKRRYLQKKRLLSAVNSVFNLARLSRGGYTRAREDHEQRT